MGINSIKGFSVRRAGRPIGSRAIDSVQSDFFPTHKFISQLAHLNSSKNSIAAASRPQPRSGEDVSAAGLPPATNRGGKVTSNKSGFLIKQGLNDE